MSWLKVWSIHHEIVSHKTKFQQRHLIPSKTGMAKAVLAILVVPALKD